MHVDTLSPGGQLAGRYRVEDLVGETHRSQTWRAVDRILNRSVSVQVVAGGDPAADAFLDAARAATAVEDPRFLRVLDAAREDHDGRPMAYVVREWARGVSLDTVLQQGPLPAPRAAEVVREVAEAIAAAHGAGVQHGRLDPARVIVKHNGAVRVLGLATDQALHAAASAHSESTADTVPTTVPTSGPGHGGADAERADVTGLGRLLYACLVARWPGGRDLGLPSAPTEHGRLLRPRQVRAGIDRAVDAACDRILGNPPRHHASRLETAGDVARELATLQLVNERPAAYAADDTAPHAVLPGVPDPAGPPPAVHHVPPPRTGPSAPAPTKPDRDPDRHTGARAPVWLGIALLVGLIAVLGYFVGRVGSDVLPTAESDPPTSRTDRTEAPPVPVDVQAISDFDPAGTDGGVENPEEAPFAVDGDAATVWSTQSYFNSPELGLLKPGVGLLVDLGASLDVAQVDVTVLGVPTRLSVLAAPEATTAPTTVAGLQPLDQLLVETADESGLAEASVQPEEPVTTRWLVVWLTSLPPVATDTYEGAIAEIVVTG